MKMIRNKISIKIYFMFTLLIFINSTEDKSNNEKNENKQFINSNISTNSNSNQFIVPHITKAPEWELQHRTLIPLDHMDHVTPRVEHIINNCPCAVAVRCKPCGIAAPLGPSWMSNVDCPCAPRLNCPVCPPLSIIHEIAAKKAEHDQKLAYSLKSGSSKISSLFDMVIKYSGDIVKYESEAREAAKKMEEASLKAEFARKNMFSTSEKARLIAKTGIVENRPCSGIACNMNPSPTFGFYSDKVFPEEVDSIKDFMNDAFSTNVNGYRGQYGNSLSRMQSETQRMSEDNDRFNTNEQLAYKRYTAYNRYYDNNENYQNNDRNIIKRNNDSTNINTRVDNDANGSNAKLGDSNISNNLSNDSNNSNLSNNSHSSRKPRRLK